MLALLRRSFGIVRPGLGQFDIGQLDIPDVTCHLPETNESLVSGNFCFETPLFYAFSRVHFRMSVQDHLRLCAFVCVHLRPRAFMCARCAYARSMMM